MNDSVVYRAVLAGVSAQIAVNNFQRFLEPQEDSLEPLRIKVRQVVHQIFLLIPVPYRSTIRSAFFDNLGVAVSFVFMKYSGDPALNRGVLPFSALLMGSVALLFTHFFRSFVISGIYERTRGYTETPSVTEVVHWTSKFLLPSNYIPVLSGFDSLT